MTEVMYGSAEVVIDGVLSSVTAILYSASFDTDPMSVYNQKSVHCKRLWRLAKRTHLLLLALYMRCTAIRRWTRPDMRWNLKRIH